MPKQKEFKGMQVIEVPIDDIIFAEYNPRRLTESQHKSLKDSLTRFGMVDPVIVNQHPARKNIMVGGHMRARVWKELGNKTIPAVFVNLPLDKEKELNVRLNKNTGEWDFDILANQFEIEDLKGWGFEEEELTGNFALVPEETEGDDDIPENVETRTVTGDLYELGNHRLLCGDSSIITNIEKVMDGENADLIFTDPPYGVAIGDKNKALNSVQKAGRCLDNIEGDCLTPDNLKALLLDVFKNCYIAAKDKCAFYVCSPQGGGLGMMMMMMMMMEAGLEVKHILNWVKNAPTFSIGRLDYDYQHEPILFTWKKTHKKNMKGDHRTSCWFIDKPRESKLHPTMKPIAIPENAILNSSDKADIVLDPFGGAGSTLIAAERTGRHCRMLELSPRYCDVIVQRYVDFCKANDRGWSVKINSQDISNEFSENSVKK